MKPSFKEINLIEYDLNKGASPSPFAICFLYTPQGNFKVVGGSTTVTHQISTDFTHYVMNLTLFKSGISRHIWMSSHFFIEKKMASGRKPSLKELRSGITGTRWHFELKDVPDKLFGRFHLSFKRIPNKWIPEYDDLITSGIAINEKVEKESSSRWAESITND